MRGSLLGVGVVIGGLAVAAWALRDHPALAPWLARFAPPAAKLPAPARGTAARKCVGTGGQVVYTDGTCPAGLREAALAGELSVLPAPPVPQPPAPAAVGQTARGDPPQ